MKALIRPIVAVVISALCFHASAARAGFTTLESLTLNSQGPAVTSSTLILGAQYQFLVSGVYTYGTPALSRQADAEWIRASTSPFDWGELHNTGTALNDVGDVMVAGGFVDWAGHALTTDPFTIHTFSPVDHTYSLIYTGTGAAVQFSLADSPLSDNTGELDITILVDLATVPEPASLGLMLGALSLLLVRRRRA